MRSAVADGERVIVSFDYAEGLQVEEIPGQAGNDERRHARPDRASLVSFEVAEYEGCFYPAKAEIVGETVVLTCPEVKHPKLVRYAWEPFTRANLCNTAGLPASTFRIEVH